MHAKTGVRSIVRASWVRLSAPRGSTTDSLAMNLQPLSAFSLWVIACDHERVKMSMQANPHKAGVVAIVNAKLAILSTGKL